MTCIDASCPLLLIFTLLAAIECIAFCDLLWKAPHKTS